MHSSGISALGAVLLIASAGFACRAEPGRVYFHHGDGEVHLSNGRTADVRVSEGTIAYGAATLSAEKPPVLRLDFALGALGELWLDVGPFSGMGAYGGLKDVYLAVDGGPFRCYEGCGGCTVNIDGASDVAMSGALSCLSLSNCPGALNRPDGADPPCHSVTAAVVDLTGTFRLDEANHKVRDY